MSGKGKVKKDGELSLERSGALESWGGGEGDGAADDDDLMSVVKRGIEHDPPPEPIQVLAHSPGLSWLDTDMKRNTKTVAKTRRVIILPSLCAHPRQLQGCSTLSFLPCRNPRKGTSQGLQRRKRPRVVR
jgi:hypothetical protein